MKLEENMYVRTKKGVFAKSKLDGWFGIGFDDNDKEMIEIDVFPNFILKEDIVKASHNIIDLIEVGDYVDGVEINLKDEKGVYHGANDAWDEVHFTDPKHIHNIVTKEQFESMSYKVGE